ncbi:MAG TPA: GNAT family N-acetyltransferase [Chloroflexi bacterium]|nr:GNAT family N-acetyltransferase [Chloroflexota bacterium]
MIQQPSPTVTVPTFQKPVTLKQGDAVLIRTARISEVEDIRALFEEEVRAGRMLPRSPHEMRAHINDWLVAEEDGAVIGCVSLVFFNDELCELRSLAVAPEQQGRGLGLALIGAAVELARLRGMRRVLSLTRAVELFERAGFRRDFLANFPQKVWRDCRPCPLRHRCDEVALIYYLDNPPSTAATGGNGKHV